ncbi:hypothetical protein QF037_000842 [Streptomyces canus]|uniref:hypothetical protein n=1 Tax=Streptomyces canus TaxID=58343 RepID=UPI00278AD4FB|nr:hypothetical protein [Streptomyces canus]MDQ0596497.1 hypothetical protein [Streptomyces canus]
MTQYALTVDPGVRDLRAADHLLQELAAELALSEGAFGCTHRCGETARASPSLAVPSEPLLRTVKERLTDRGHEVQDGVPDPVAVRCSAPGPPPSPAR